MQELTDYLAKNNKNHLIFDFDGTLAQMELDWFTFTNDLIDAFKKFDANYVEKLQYNTREDLHNLMVMQFGKDAMEKSREIQKDFEINNLRGLKINEELCEFVKNDTNHEKFVWTSNTRVRVNSLLDQLGIKDKFQKIVTMTDVELLKPRTDGFFKIYEPAKNHLRRDFLMIGNSEYADGGAAKNCSIDFFKVTV